MTNSSFKGALSSQTIFDNWKLFKNDKKYFYFSSIALFVLNFCLDFLVLYKNGLISKIRLISKFMTSNYGQQTIAIHILFNISSNKDNQTMKFGQLVACNIRNILLEKSYTKCGAETIPRLFSKKSKLSISLNH